jgi:hypothetical protein
MFTAAGNRAVAQVVNALLEGLTDRSIRDAIDEVVERPFALAGFSAEAVLSG